MRIPPKHVLCGVIDGLLTAAIVFFIAVIAGLQSNMGLLRGLAEHWPELLSLLLPLSILIGWRGAADAARLISGRRGWIRPAAEGGVWGFLVLPTVILVAMAHEAFAAGSGLPNQYDPPGVWLTFAFESLLRSCALAGVGAIVGVAVSAANRAILGKLETFGVS